MDILSPENYLSAKEVKSILKCSLPLVYKMAERGQLLCIRWECPGVGKKKQRTKIIFKKSDVLKFIEKHYISEK